MPLVRVIKKAGSAFNLIGSTFFNDFLRLVLSLNYEIGFAHMMYKTCKKDVDDCTGIVSVTVD